MFTLTIQLLEVGCFKTESVHSSDKFVLNGVIYTDEGTAVGVALPIIRINDGERRDLSKYTYTLQSEKRIVHFALSGWDIDNNDSWTENEDKLAAIAGSIAAGVSVINPVVGGVVAAAAAVAKEVTDLFTGWDSNDHLFDFQYTQSFGEPVFIDNGYSETLTPNFRGEGAIANVNYSLTIRVDCSAPPEVVPTYDYAALFRTVNEKASAEGFVGAFPSCIFLNKPDGSVWMPCVCFRSGQADWQDVPLRQLQEIDLNDFGGRMRVTQDYAVRHGGYVGGFPNYFDAQYQEHVCGTLLLPPSTAEWRDVGRVEDLMNVPLDDIGRRFRESMDYATRQGYVGGFPNMYDATYDGRQVCGTILIKPGQAELHEILLSFPPR